MLSPTVWNALTAFTGHETMDFLIAILLLFCKLILCSHLSPLSENFVDCLLYFIRFIVCLQSSLNYSSYICDFSQVRQVFFAEGPTIGPRSPTGQSVLREITGFIIGVKFRAFLEQLWCKIHWRLQSRDTNTILCDCIPVILYLFSERIRHRSWTVVWLTGIGLEGHGGRKDFFQVCSSGFS